MLRTLSTFALLFAAGCTQPSETTNSSQTPAAGPQADTLVIGAGSTPKHLYSATNNSVTGSVILGAINLPVIDTEFDCSIKKQRTGLVNEWEWRDDGKVLWMKIRQGVKWQDGVDVTAQDIAFTYDVVTDPTVASPRNNYTERMLANARPKVLSDHEIEWHFVNPYDRDTQIAHTSLVPMPRHKLISAPRDSLRAASINKSPLASGPFKVTVLEPNKRVVLEVNEAYSGPPERTAHLKRVIVRAIPEYATRLLELQNGSIDAMTNLTVADADMLTEKNPEFSIKRRGWRFLDYVSWNLDNELFSDPRVRQGLAHGVDVDAMIAQLLTSKSGEAFARRAVGTITPALCNMHNDTIAPISFKKVEALRLLAEAGWTDSNKDGYLDKDGKKFEFTLSTNSGNKRRSDTAVLLQSQLKDLGIKVNIEKLAPNAFSDRMRRRDFEAGLYGLSSALFVDPTNTWHSDSPGQKRQFNYSNYNNSKVDELINKGLATPMPKESSKIFKEMQSIIYKDQPFLFLWWRDEIVAVNNRFENTSVDIMSPFGNLYQWSVPADKVKYPK